MTSGMLLISDRHDGCATYQLWELSRHRPFFDLVNDNLSTHFIHACTKESKCSISHDDCGRHKDLLVMHMHRLMPCCCCIDVIGVPHGFFHLAFVKAKAERAWLIKCDLYLSTATTTIRLCIPTAATGGGGSTNVCFVAIVRLHLNRSLRT